MDYKLGNFLYVIMCIGFIVYGIYSIYTYKTVKPTPFTVVEVKEIWRKSDNENNNNIDYYENIVIVDSDKRQYDYCYKSDNSPNLPKKGQTINNLYIKKGKIKKIPSIIGSIVFIIMGMAGILVQIIGKYYFIKDLKR